MNGTTSHKPLTRLLAGFKDDVRGATAIEYALIAMLVSIAIVGGVIGLRDALVGVPLENASQALQQQTQ